MNFGECIEDIRLRNVTTLRQLSKDIGFDSAYISRIEKGITQPSYKFVNRFLNYFGIIENTDKYEQVIDLYYISRNEIPEYLLEKKEAIRILPRLFRYAHNHAANEESYFFIFDGLKYGALGVDPRPFAIDIRTISSFYQYGDDILEIKTYSGQSHLIKYEFYSFIKLMKKMNE